MKDFIFEVGTKILFGKNQLSKLPNEVKKYGDRVLICYGGGSIKKNGIYDEVVKLFRENEIDFYELSGIEPNPRLTSVVEGIKIARDNNVDLILPIGGGSAIDCAKLIAVGYYYDGDPWDIVVGDKKPTKALPIGTILTIAATGSEMDTASVITNLKTREKLGWGSHLVLPKFSFLNPEFTFTVNKYHTIAGTCDIMSHTMENYFSMDEGVFLQDSFSEAVLKTCIKYLPCAIENPYDYEARANLLWANSWAINGLLSEGKTNGWSVHAMEHELSAYYDVTHGMGLAVLTPNWLSYILSDKTKGKIAEFGYNVFNLEKSDDVFKDAKNAIKALRDFFDSVGVAKNLRELGIDDSLLREMAHMAVTHKGGFINGYVPLNEDDVYEIYKLSL